MYPTLTMPAFQPIVDLFQEDADQPVKAYIDMNRLFIQGNGSELMVRFNQVSKRITIARVAFLQTRRGFGSRLTKELEAYGKKTGTYHTLVLENVSTEQAYWFAVKNGFTRTGDALFPPNSPFYFYGDYQKRIEK